MKVYPQFEPIGKEMKSLFDDAFLKYQPFISEFTFTNLYCWRDVYGFSVSNLEGFILLRFAIDDKLWFLPPIGPCGRANLVIEKIIKDTKGSFMRLPSATAELLEKEKSFHVQFDRDNSDYLYKTERLKLLEGRKYDGKRNLIKKFKALHEYEYVKLDSSNASECLNFQERWCVVKNCNKIEGLNKERQAVGEMINNFGYLNLTGAVIKVKASICAVAIAQRLNATTLVMHVLKADPNMQGLYQVMLNDFLLNDSGNFEYVNLEQDLGVAGLRQAKLSYQPDEIIKKYIVSLS